MDFIGLYPDAELETVLYKNKDFPDIELETVIRVEMAITIRLFEWLKAEAFKNKRTFAEQAVHSMEQHRRLSETLKRQKHPNDKK